MAHEEIPKISLRLDQQTTREINLGVLQRIDPAILEVLSTASHVTLYQFDKDSKTWSRKDVEGSLFVVKRREQPRFQFIVMNRRSADNLVEDLLGEFEYEFHPPQYLLYKNSVGEVNGIWFYHTKECDQISKLFARILHAFGRQAPKPPVIPARMEFEELEGSDHDALLSEPLEPKVHHPLPASKPLNPLDAWLQGGSVRQTNPKPVPVHYTDPSYADSVSEISHLSHPTVAASSAIDAKFKFLSSDMEGGQTPSTQAPIPALGPATIPSACVDVSSKLLAPSFFAINALESGSVVEPAYHGTPLLQPFPPSAPPLTLSSSPSMGSTTLTRQSLKNALIKLAQDDKFINLLFDEIRLAQN